MTTIIQSEPIFELFILYSALNYNGYDKENNPAGMHPLRLKVRDYLKQVRPEKFNFAYHPYQYTKQVLSPDHINPDFDDVFKYLELFQKTVDLGQLWTKVEIGTERELNLYRPKLSALYEEVNDLLDIPRADIPILFTVNLLESYYRGFSINLPDKTILITGPSIAPNLGNFVHELIHSYLYDKNLSLENIEHKDYPQIPKALRKNYPPEKIFEESLARALTVYLSSKSKVLENRGLDKQAKELFFPKKFLDRLEQINPSKITLAILKDISA